MMIFERLERRRAWGEDEGMVLKQVRRLADEMIAPQAERHDRTGEFPWRM